MSTYPRTWVLRSGPEQGKVLIQFTAFGPALLVGPDGSVQERFRVPAEVRRELSTTNEEVA